MRTRAGQRGVTIAEFLGASAMATIVGGSMLLLMTGMRQAYQAHTTFRQLSGYLDVASTMLRNDIWGATASCQGANCPAGNDCPPAGGTTWLALDLPTSGGATGWGTGPDVCYVVDQTVAANPKLIRYVWNGTNAWGAGWPVAQYIVPPSTPPAGGTGTTATVASPQITLELWVNRTVNGRPYPRQIRDLRYYMQVP